MLHISISKPLKDVKSKEAKLRQYIQDYAHHQFSHMQNAKSDI